uniref:Transcription factor CBF/NF-Y/archaeal histone domain-containing protein n=1 Tax=Brassica oleracea var. oleracea TaxID=109376 RepID=A0A0D3CC98_BRAOL
MERGVPLSHYQLPNSNSGLNMDHQNNSIPAAIGNLIACDDKNKSNVEKQQPCMAREQDQYMPIANVIRIMRRTLPPHAKISDDAKETIQECVSEYISFVTGEANERCQREQRKTITAEDILWAMSKLGFDDYVGPLNLFINRYREFESDRGCSLRGESSSFKPAFGGNGFGFHGPPQGPPHPGHYGYGMLDQSTVMGGGRYYQNGSGQDGSDGCGGSSSSMDGMPVFDQYDSIPMEERQELRRLIPRQLVATVLGLYTIYNEGESGFDLSPDPNTAWGRRFVGLCIGVQHVSSYVFYDGHLQIHCNAGGAGTPAEDKRVV